MECEYTDCRQNAVIRLGLADPDAEGSVYCKGHASIRKQEIIIEIFGWKSESCIVLVDGRNCYNAKKFGEYCGIHIKHRKGSHNTKGDN